MRSRPLMLIMSLSLLAACATGTLALKEDNIEAKLAGSPYVTRYSRAQDARHADPSDIEVHYKVWGTLSRPDALEHWQFHFKIGEGSEPTRRYVRVASVVHYTRARNDSEGVDVLKAVAAKEGGDAIMNVWRSPAIDAITLPANVLGYRYHADVVRYRGEPR